MIIVDTNVIIDIERGKINLENLLKKIEPTQFCISSITLMELYAGLGYSKEKKGEKFYTKQKSHLDTIISDFEIIPLNNSILKEAGLKRGNLLGQGIIIDNEDIIIGITAEYMNVTLIITQNIDHFKHFSLEILKY